MALMKVVRMTDGSENDTDDGSQDDRSDGSENGTDEGSQDDRRQ